MNDRTENRAMGRRLRMASLLACLGGSLAALTVVHARAEPAYRVQPRGFSENDWLIFATRSARVLALCGYRSLTLYDSAGYVEVE